MVLRCWIKTTAYNAAQVYIFLQLVWCCITLRPAFRHREILWAARLPIAASFWFPGPMVMLTRQHDPPYVQKNHLRLTRRNAEGRKASYPKFHSLTFSTYGLITALSVPIGGTALRRRRIVLHPTTAKDCSTCAPATELRSRGKRTVWTFIQPQVAVRSKPRRLSIMLPSVTT